MMTTALGMQSSCMHTQSRPPPFLTPHLFCQPTLRHNSSPWQHTCSSPVQASCCSTTSACFSQTPAHGFICTPPVPQTHLLSKVVPANMHQQLSCGKTYHQRRQGCRVHTRAAAPPIQSQSQSTSSSPYSDSAASASSQENPGSAPANMGTGSTTIDHLSETQQYVLADEWGYDQIGSNLPEGARPDLIAQNLPDSFFQVDIRRVICGIAVPLSLMVAGYAYLWYMQSICPWWQQLLAGLVIGTGYTGLFAIAHECAKGSLLPGAPEAESILGTLLMAPALYSFDSWRTRFFAHLQATNMLHHDIFAWHPTTTEDVATMSATQRTLTWLFTCTPLKLLSTIGHWFNSFDGLDLKMHPAPARPAVLAGWALPVLLAGFVWPLLFAGTGLQGWMSCWLVPWLVFHFWLSLLTLVQHTAPHIPFRQSGPSYDAGQASISGTITVTFPRWLEFLLNDANYHLPQHLAPSVPFYHARSAYHYLRSRLKPYLTETRFTLKLLTNLITVWQIYDPAAQRYLKFDDVVSSSADQPQQTASSGNGVENVPTSAQNGYA